MTHLTHSDSVIGNTKKGTITGEFAQKRSRQWFFTINHYDSSHIQKFRNILGEKYVTFQTEIGSKSKIPHIHAIVCFRNQRTGGSLKKQWPTAHLEVVKNLQRCTEYCQKERTWSGIRFERVRNEIRIDVHEPQNNEMVSAKKCFCGKYLENELIIGSKKWIKHFVIHDADANEWLATKIEKQFAKGRL